MISKATRRKVELELAQRDKERRRRERFLLLSSELDRSDDLDPMSISRTGETTDRRYSHHVNRLFQTLR